MSDPIKSRDQILERIRRALPAEEGKAGLPDYDPEVLHSAPRLEGDNPWEIFARNFAAVNGRPMTNLGELSALLLERECTSGYCDPFWMEAVGGPLRNAGLHIETEFDRSRYDDYAFGITRARGAIAESGSLILDDDWTSDRLAALAPWVHVGLLEEREVIRTIPEAIAQFGDCPNIIWVTGPSKTADVEGILIEGVHGPGEQVALRL